MPQLKRLAEVYMRGTGVAPTTLGKLITKSNNRLILQLIDPNGTVLADNAELASDWFLQNWPDGVPWPAEVPRECNPSEAVE